MYIDSYSLLYVYIVLTFCFSFQNLSPFEVYLEPSARELMEALRALFIQTHWHSFTILADDSVASSVLLRRDLVDILKEPPLRPTIVRLPNINQAHPLFRLVSLFVHSKLMIT